MSWAQTIKLYVDIGKTGGLFPLLSGSTIYAGAIPGFVQGEKFKLRLYFREIVETDGVKASSSSQLASGAAVVVSGKVKGGLHDGDLLFYSDTFIEALDDADYYYEGDVDLNTVAVATLLDSDSDEIRVEIQVQESGNVRRSKFQFDCRLYHEVYAGEGAPTDADPEYPTPGDIITVAPTGAGFKFTDGNVYLYNPDDSLWYPLRVATVDGVAVLAIGEGVA